MITAQEALSHYDEINILAEKFIKSTIEPAIREVMQEVKQVKFSLIEVFCVGHTFDFGVEMDGLNKNYHKGIKVTDKVIDILESNGYTVTSKVGVKSNDRFDGTGLYTISWEETEC